LEKLRIRNSWLESQTPEARQAEQLRRDIERKRQILANKGNMLKLLDQTPATDNLTEAVVAPNVPQMGD